MLMYSSLCFNGYEINLNELIPGEEFNDGLLIKNNKIYFSTRPVNSRGTPKSDRDYTFRIYESNLSGTEISLFYSREYETYHWAYAKDDSFYIEYRPHSNQFFWEEERNIDKFTLSTGEHINIVREQDCSLYDYETPEESKYKIEDEDGNRKETGKFIITNTETGEIRIVDEGYMKRTAYITSLEKFGYGVDSYAISNGHILLIFYIYAGDGWSCSNVIFEYNFDTDELDYKALIFSYGDYPQAIYLDSSE